MKRNMHLKKVHICHQVRNHNNLRHLIEALKGIEKLFPQSLVPTVRSTRQDSNKSQSPGKLIRHLSMYCELIGIQTKLLYTLVAGLKRKPSNQADHKCIYFYNCTRNQIALSITYTF